VIAVVWTRDGDPAALPGRLLAKLGWDGALTRTDLGAPESDWLTARGLSVSLTRTDGLAACAVARGGMVGVDAEAVDPAVDTDAVAAMHFGADAATGATEEEKRDRFFRLWALQEAALKALGVGFSTPVDLAVTLDPATVTGGEPAGLVWKTFEIGCGPAHRLAAAMAVAPDLQPLLIAGEFI